MTRKILLSFDVEEFDMPLEYNQNISIPEQLLIGNSGVAAITPILSNKNVRTTLFTTATYAQAFPETIKNFTPQHEIASHTFYHSFFKDEHLLQSKLALEAITNIKVTGLRMPRMRTVAMEEVLKAGYKYDSSINPTCIPGRYNNFHLSRTVYDEKGVKRIPTSVTPNLRIPLFWLAFKNSPYALYKKWVLQTLKHDGYVCLYFHPWEFSNAIRETAIPNYTKRWCGEPLLDRLQQLIKDLTSEGEFVTMNELFNS